MITKTTEKSSLIKAANEEGLRNALGEMWDYSPYEQEYPRQMEKNFHIAWEKLNTTGHFDFIIPLLAHEIKDRKWPEQVTQQMDKLETWTSSIVTVAYDNPQYVKTFCNFSIYRSMLGRISLLWQYGRSIVVYSHFKRLKAEKFVLSVADCIDVDGYEMHSWYEGTQRWMDRSKKLRKEKGKCERCVREKGLCSHHLTYENIGYEKDEDLIVLCRKCHGGEHARLRKEEYEKEMSWKNEWFKREQEHVWVA